MEFIERMKNLTEEYKGNPDLTEEEGDAILTKILKIAVDEVIDLCASKVQDKEAVLGVKNEIKYTIPDESL